MDFLQLFFIFLAHFCNMHIKHNQANEIFHVTYSEWFREYLKTGKFKNFTVTNPKGVVEVHSIDPKTGEMRFSQLMDEKQAQQTRIREPRRFHIKPLEFKLYDKNLVPNEEYFKIHPDSSIKPHLNLSKAESLSRPRKRNIWYSLPKLKIIYERIINSTISKVTSNIITGVLIAVLALLIWALWGNWLTEQAKSIFNQ